jgi:hypothetical protein
VTFRWPARCATRFTSAAASLRGRCTASGLGAGIRTTERAEGRHDRPEGQRAGAEIYRVPDGSGLVPEWAYEAYPADELATLP